MRNELLAEQQDRQQRADNYKKVRIGVVGDFLFGNDDMDKPIFQKRNLQYDKYQLCKLISFEDFELLIRPFKKDPAYKKCILLRKIFIASIIIFVLALVSTKFVAQMQDDNQIIFLIWATIICGSSFVFMGSPFIMFKIYGDAYKALQSYCSNLDLGHNNFQISGCCKSVQRNILKWARRQQQTPGKYSCLFVQYDAIYLKSNTILQDQDSLKLYVKRSPLEPYLNQNIQKPIFSTSSFTFDNERLQKMIPFQQLQLLLRPFKANDNYKKVHFFTKSIMWAIPFILLVFIPMIVFNNITKQTSFMIFLICYLTLVYGSIAFMTWRLQKTRAKLIVQFTEYCKQISIKQRKVEIVVHLDQRKIGSRRRSGIYCLQIKKIAND